jgi:hypothetical protein
LRSRAGAWTLLAEVLVLAAVMTILWSTWQGRFAGLTDMVWTFLQALPLALVAVYLLPALAFVGGGVLWETVRALLAR